MTRESMSFMFSDRDGRLSALGVVLESGPSTWRAVVRCEGEADRELFGAGAGPDVFAIARQHAAAAHGRQRALPAGWRVLAGGQALPLEREA